MNSWYRLILFLCFLLPLRLNAQVKPDTLLQPMPDTTVAWKDTTVIEQIVDTVKQQLKAPIVQVPVKLKALILPGAFFAYGALSLNVGELKLINQRIRNTVWTGKNYSGRPPEDYLLLAPAAAVYVLNWAGVPGQNNLIDRSIMYGMSNLIANGIGFGVKQFGLEWRPDSSDRHSFPSGHTAEAFVSAEFARLEYRRISPWPGIAGYATAVTTAYLRMRHNKHWFGDVVAGAGVGIASTRFAYYLYPLIKHVLFGSKKIKDPLTSLMILPTYKEGAFGFAMMVGF